MKARRSCGLEQLVELTTGEVAKLFAPTPLAIKKRIEALIELDFMERDKENRSLFHYVS
jgi:hypothetical protein